MRLYLINPSNPLVSIVRLEKSRWNRYRVWQPLSLMVLAGLTPPEWDITIVAENVGIPDYPAMPRPDLVGITAFTAQAPRAYEISARFRRLSVPVVMGGIHATMCVDEVMPRVDSVVTGEADAIWPQVLEDAAHARLKRRYDGGLSDMDAARPARHDLLSGPYAFGAIQTTRGCPMNCTFCSVTAFNGAQYRQRPYRRSCASSDRFCSRASSAIIVPATSNPPRFAFAECEADIRDWSRRTWRSGGTITTSGSRAARARHHRVQSTSPTWQNPR